MKNKIMLLGLVSMAAFAIAGCNKETGETPESGVKTFASFSITVSNPATRADANAVEEETGIRNVSIYIFSNEALESQGTITLTNQNKGTTTVATTTGPKRIYAVVNKSVTANIGMSQTDFESQLLNAEVADIATSGQFLMVGATDATLVRRTQDEAIQNANLVPINVTRAAAKVQMQYKSTTRVADNVDATVSNVQYDLGQRNTQMYLVRNNYEVTPKGTKTEQTDADGDGTYDHLVKFQENLLSLVNAVETFDHTFANSRYLGENVNDTPVTGNSSFVVIKLKVTPNSGADTDGSFWVVAKSDPSKGTVEYASETGKIKYFSSDAAAQGHLTTNATALTGYSVQKFNQGFAWYRLNLRDVAKTDAKERYAVLRNHYYKVNVTEIFGLGFNTPEAIIPKDPDTPLETSTYVSAEITIEDWTAVEMNEPLG